MKISLVTCPSFTLTSFGPRPDPYIPLGLLVVASIAEGLGHIVEIIDINQGIVDGRISYSKDFAEQTASIICASKPDLVGFTTMCNSYPQTLRIATALNAQESSIPIILGGPQATAVDIETLEAFPFITAIIRGEAESCFSSLLGWFLGEAKIESILGVTYRIEGQVYRNPDAPLIMDLDTVPIPAYHLYPIANFNRIPIEAGRGCPFECTFCSTNLFFRRRYRIKSPERMIAEIKMLHEMTGVQEFQLVHDMFTIDRREVRAFCEKLISTDLQVSWRCSARVDCVDTDLLAIMSKSGCTGMFFGIETGSENTQLKIKKRLEVENVIPILGYAADLGIDPTASFIIGFPEETLSDVYATISLAANLLKVHVFDIQFHLLSPLPGSPLQVQYGEQLLYRSIFSSITWNILQRDDYLLITKYPRIFSSFYAFPLRHIPVALLYCTILAMFFFSRLARMIHVVVNHAKKPSSSSKTSTLNFSKAIHNIFKK